jgi:hypothetical protein
MSWSSYWSLSFCLSHQYPICIPLLLIRAKCHVHLILRDLIILIIFGEEKQLTKHDVFGHWKWSYGYFCGH